MRFNKISRFDEEFNKRLGLLHKIQTGVNFIIIQIAMQTKKYHKNKEEKIKQDLTALVVFLLL